MEGARGGVEVRRLRELKELCALPSFQNQATPSEFQSRLRFAVRARAPGVLTSRDTYELVAWLPYCKFAALLNGSVSKVRVLCTLTLKHRRCNISSTTLPTPKLDRLENLRNAKCLCFLPSPPPDRDSWLPPCAHNARLPSHVPFASFNFHAQRISHASFCCTAVEEIQAGGVRWHGLVELVLLPDEATITVPAGSIRTSRDFLEWRKGGMEWVSGAMALSYLTFIGFVYIPCQGG